MASIERNYSDVNRIYFPRLFAANLLQDAAKSKYIKSGYYYPIFPKSALYINRENIQLAREMFVFSDQTILRPSVADIIDITDIDRHAIVSSLEYIHGKDLEKEHVLETRERIGRKCKQYILRNLAAEGIHVNGLKYDSFLKIIRNGDWPDTDQLKFTQIESQLEALHETLVMYRQGIPYFGPVLPMPKLRSKTVSFQKGRDISSVVQFYFENTIYCPSPKSFEQALLLRQNKNIREWRKQLRSWSTRLIAQQTSPSEIKKEINEANDYIRGAEFPSRLIPKWSMLVTLPLSVISSVAPELHHLSWVALSLDLINLYGWAVEKAVKSSNREQYRWLLISNIK